MDRRRRYFDAMNLVDEILVCGRDCRHRRIFRSCQGFRELVGYCSVVDDVPAARAGRERVVQPRTLTPTWQKQTTRR